MFNNEDDDFMSVYPLLEDIKAILEDELAQALILAAPTGTPEMATFLLNAAKPKKDQILSYTDDTGHSALNVAAFWNNTPFAEVLLETGADPNLKDSGNGWTPLFDATYGRATDTLRVLLENEADVLHRDKYGRIPLDLAQSDQDMLLLLSAIHTRKVSLENDGSVETFQVSKTYFEKAVEKCWWSSVEHMIRYHDVFKTDDAMRPHLTRAVRSLNFELAELLLIYGADPNKQTSCAAVSEEVLNPLHAVILGCPEGRAMDAQVQNKRISMFDLLVSYGADPSKPCGPSGMAILQAALLHSDKVMVERLLMEMPLPVLTRDREGRLPVHFAGTETLSLVLSDGESALINARDHQSRLPIHLFAGRGSLVGLHYILENTSADIVLEQDLDGWNVLHWACRSGEAEVVVRVLRAASGNRELVTKLTTARENISGWTPRDIVIRHQGFDQIVLKMVKPPGVVVRDGPDALEMECEWMCQECQRQPCWRCGRKNCGSRAHATCDSCFSVSLLPARGWKVNKTNNSNASENTLYALQVSVLPASEPMFQVLSAC